MAYANTDPGVSVRIITHLTELTVVIGLTMFLPFVVHMIPSWDDSPIGGKLLPIFYAPLIAALTRKWHVSLIASVVSPWLNYLIFGSPNLGMACMLSLQLLPFCWFAFYAGHRFGARFWIGPAAYVVSKPVLFILFWVIPTLMPHLNPFVFLYKTTVQALPGLIILGIISYLSTRVFPPDAHA